MKKWTDKDMLEFARVASQGAYGKYRGCRTLKSKLKKYETIMNIGRTWADDRKEQRWKN